MKISIPLLVFLLATSYSNACFKLDFFGKQKAKVRIGEPICKEELEFRKVRFPEVKKAQQEMLGEFLEDDDVLEIGFSCSGGGWRAMCCSAGFMSGAQKIGLLDTAMYVSALSGSTWLIAPWIYSGMDIEDFKNRVITVAADGIDIDNPEEFMSLMGNIISKMKCFEHINIVDFYGALLANTLLKGLSKNHHKICLSDQKKQLKKGKFPMPVYTSISAIRGLPEDSYEYTPYEIGTRALSTYIPTWSFGRTFDKGESTNSVPEQYMGFMMGIFGSAFAADFKETYDAILKNAKLPKSIDNIFTQATFGAFKKFLEILSDSKSFGDIRLFYAKVPNFNYNLEQAQKLKEYKDLKLADSGTNIDNPVFAAYRKGEYGDAPDIIFVFDSSASIDFSELKLLVDYAKEHELKFPIIKEYKVDESVLNVFMDLNDLSIPAIVYMPIVNGYKLLKESERTNVDKYYKDKLTGFDIKKESTQGFAKTFNFNYSEDQAEKLIAMTEFNIISVKEVIVQIVKERVNLKRKLLTL